jgi:hypothetical protein
MQSLLLPTGTRGVQLLESWLGEDYDLRAAALVIPGSFQDADATDSQTAAAPLPESVGSRMRR